MGHPEKMLRTIRKIEAEILAEEEGEAGRVTTSEEFEAGTGGLHRARRPGMGKYSHLSRQEKLDLLKSRWKSLQSLKRIYEHYVKSKSRRLRELKVRIDSLAQDRESKREQDSSTEQGVHPV